MVTTPDFKALRQRICAYDHEEPRRSTEPCTCRTIEPVLRSVYEAGRADERGYAASAFREQTPTEKAAIHDREIESRDAD